MQCPEDNTTLVMTDRAGVEIDYCPQCRGVWLDRGELDELPEIDSLLVERPNEAPMGAGESASVPSAAAVGNAIFDATGVRLFEVPFTPSRVLAALKAAKTAAASK